jgi:hypothetical protein
MTMQQPPASSYGRKRSVINAPSPGDATRAESNQFLGVLDGGLQRLEEEIAVACSSCYRAAPLTARCFVCSGLMCGGPACAQITCSEERCRKVVCPSCRDRISDEPPAYLCRPHAEERQTEALMVAVILVFVCAVSAGGFYLWLR